MCFGGEFILPQQNLGLFISRPFKTSSPLEVQIHVVCGSLDHAWGLGFHSVPFFQPLILKPSPPIFTPWLRLVFSLLFLVRTGLHKGGRTAAEDGHWTLQNPKAANVSCVLVNGS